MQQTDKLSRSPLEVFIVASRVAVFQERVYPPMRGGHGQNSIDVGTAEGSDSQNIQEGPSSQIDLISELHTGYVMSNSCKSPVLKILIRSGCDFTFPQLKDSSGRKVLPFAITLKSTSLPQLGLKPCFSPSMFELHARRATPWHPGSYAPRSETLPRHYSDHEKGAGL